MMTKKRASLAYRNIVKYTLYTQNYTVSPQKIEKIMRASTLAQSTKHPSMRMVQLLASEGEQYICKTIAAIKLNRFITASLNS